MQFRRLVILSAALTAMASGHTQACPDHTSKTALAPVAPTRAAALLAWKPRAWSPASPAVLRPQGLRVAIDPVDGAMGMPSADELTALTTVGDDAPVELERAADGMLTAHLDERFEQSVVAVMGPAGKPAWTCVDGLPAAARLARRPLARPAPAAAPAWEVK